MSHIFISYSTQNKNQGYAALLAQKLRDEGFDVWIDNARLRSSENWWEKIVGALQTADAVIVLMTPEARASKWVQREVTLADNWGKQTFPLLLEGKNWEIFVLTQFRDVQGGSLPPPAFYDDLIEYVERKTKRGADLAEKPVVTPLDTEAKLAAANPPEVEIPPPTFSTPLPKYVPDRQPMSPMPVPPKPTRRISRVGVTVAAMAAVVVIGAMFVLNRPPALTDVEQTATIEANHVLNTETAIRTTSTAVAHEGGIFAQETSIALTQASADQTATATSWTDTPSPTSTPTETLSPTLQPTPLGGGLGKIVFASERDGNSEIYVMDADGDNQQRLTYNGAHDFSPMWSPDGTKIVFTSSPDGEREIYVMDADGGNLQRLTDHSNDDSDDFDPRWSPDGTKIVFWSNRDINFEIYVMDANGNNQQRLTNHNDEDHYPSWSPNGEKIIFVSGRDGEDEIYIMDADGGNQQRLTYNDTREYDPIWSPDGTKIVFWSNLDGNFEIYVMDADGGNQQRLTYNDAYDSAAKWSPDGRHMVFESNRNGRTEIYTMTANGSDLTILTYNETHNYSPDWR